MVWGEFGQTLDRVQKGVQREPSVSLDRGIPAGGAVPAVPSPGSVSGPPRVYLATDVGAATSPRCLCVRRRLWCRPAAPSPQLASGPPRIYLATDVATDAPLIAPLPSGRGRYFG